MRRRLVIITIILVVVLAVTGFVAAEETGIITINVFNDSDSRVVTNISNSTIQAQTNFTNSQASENITLTNSTLTLNVNGENIVISTQGGNLVVSAPGQNISLSSSNLPLVPLNIGQLPNWVSVEQTGSFNVLGVTTTPSTYTFFIEAYGSQSSTLNQLISGGTDVFPTAFYFDFGLQPMAKFVPNQGFVNIGSGASFGPNQAGTETHLNLELALFTNPNHQSNTYLPDSYNNSGEQKLLSARYRILHSPVPANRRRHLSSQP